MKRPISLHPLTLRSLRSLYRHDLLAPRPWTTTTSADPFCVMIFLLLPAIRSYLSAITYANSLKTFIGEGVWQQGRIRLGCVVRGNGS